MKTLLLVCPNSWEEVHLRPRTPLRAGTYRLLFRGGDAEACPSTFDALSFIDCTLAEFRTRRLDGVISSSDYPGCIVAAAIASTLGLPSPTPQQVLSCSHKYYSRLAQQAAVPEATPAFALIDPADLGRDTLGLDFPLFVKPVKSLFSFLARRINSFDELTTFLALPDVRHHLLQFVYPFNQLLQHYTNFELNGGYLLAETLISGMQVTVEGFVFGGNVHIIGIVDSIMYPGTMSFQRFDYPSSLSLDVQKRMEDIATRVIDSIGFDNGLFNIEMFYVPNEDKIYIIEINPRMCGQFADLMEKVNGTNTYEILLSLATGESPVVRRGEGRFKVASSFVLRDFEDKRVVRVPGAEQIENVKSRFAETLVKIYYTPGQRLSDADDQKDGYSYRYAVINMGGPDRASLFAAFEEVREQLVFSFADV